MDSGRLGAIFGGSHARLLDTGRGEEIELPGGGAFLARVSWVGGAIVDGRARELLCWCRVRWTVGRAQARRRFFRSRSPAPCGLALGRSDFAPVGVSRVCVFRGEGHRLAAAARCPTGFFLLLVVVAVHACRRASRTGKSSVDGFRFPRALLGRSSRAPPGVPSSRSAASRLLSRPVARRSPRCCFRKRRVSSSTAPPAFASHGLSKPPPQGQAPFVASAAGLIWSS